MAGDGSKQSAARRIVLGGIVATAAAVATLTGVGVAGPGTQAGVVRAQGASPAVAVTLPEVTTTAPTTTTTPPTTAPAPQPVALPAPAEPAPAPEPAAEPAPAPVPTGDAVLDAIATYFPDVYDQAVGVARCESSLNPNAVSRGGYNWGLFQINVVHKDRVAAMGYSWDQILDPYVNAAVARSIYDDAGGWGPWGCRRAAY